MCHGDGVAALEAVEVVDEVADPAHLPLATVVLPARPENGVEPFGSKCHFSRVIFGMADYDIYNN